MRSILAVKVGDKVLLRKSHPCGSFEWEVMRVGADIGLKCIGCGHRIMLSREDFERRVRKVSSNSNEDSST